MRAVSMVSVMIYAKCEGQRVIDGRLASRQDDLIPRPKLAQVFPTLCDDLVLQELREPVPMQEVHGV